MNVLGINAVFHESAAAITVDGQVVAACEEERFNRVKHGKTALVDNPHVLPEQAIKFCLDYAGLKSSDIDRVAYSFDPRLRAKEFNPEWWPESGLETEFLECLGKVGDAVETVLGRKVGRNLKFVSHHLAHAASAYYPSGFDPAAILVIDGIGEAACSTILRGDGVRIKTVEVFSYPHSLGFLWEQASLHLGFSPYDASKVMGLAAYGDPEIFKEQFASIIRVGQDDYAVDVGALGLGSAAPKGLENMIGPPRQPDSEILPEHMHIAAALQASTDAAVTALVRRIERTVGLDRLCVAGGVALNCVTNSLIRQVSSYSAIISAASRATSLQRRGVSPAALTAESTSLRWNSGPR
jgi:carbamoyltransferase